MARGGEGARPIIQVWIWGLLLPLLFSSSFLMGAPKQAPPLVIRLSLHDTVQPVSAGYLARGLGEAAQRHADLVLISLGTPGGLLESTRVMVEAIETSEVPVAVYISPSGSRAGSAGFFLLQAGDVAAMAPGTNAGAAHPVGGGSEGDATMRAKVENDTSAFLRSYVLRRGRNAKAAEDAVRQSLSYTDAEALDLKLIDLVAPDDGALLKAIDGRQVKRFDGTTKTLRTADARIVTVAPSLRERLLGRLVNPDLAVLLMVFGALLVYLEFNIPGTIIPGALGTLLLLLGLFGLNFLPIHHASVALLLAAVALLVLEAKFASHGVLAAAGIASLIFGLATLVEGPSPDQRVHLATAVGVGLGFGLITTWLATVAWKARRGKQLMGPGSMIGASALARTALIPSGQVEIRGELWQATLEGSPTALAGASVEVIGVNGLHLTVRATGERMTGPAGVARPIEE